MNRAFEKAGADDPRVVMDAVIDALSNSRRKPRVVVGKGTGALRMPSRLPVRMRGHMIKRAPGLTHILAGSTQEIA